MKYLIFDQKEFDLGSEQCLLIACSHVKHFNNINDFAIESEKANSLVRTSSINGKILKEKLSNIKHSAGLITGMQEHCSVNLKNNDVIFVIHDAWDINDFIFQNQHMYYRYLWSTTA